jgi:hypothetical protein
MKLKANGLHRKIFVATFLCIIIVLSFSANCFKTEAAAQKTVYVVINVAAQPVSEGAYLSGSSDVHPSMDVTTFSPTSGSPVTQVFSTSFRNSITDSFGGSFKMTWMAQMDYLMAQSGLFFTNGTAGVLGYTAMYDLMNKYWGTQIQNFGDQLGYYHLFEVFNGNWTSYNSGANTLDNGPDAGYPNYQNIALSHMIIDDNFYPTVFWTHFYRNVVPLAESNWVEQYIPFEYTPTFGSTSPYHLYPGMNHLQIQTLQYYDSNNLLEAFNNAVTFGSSVYSIYLLPYSDMVGNITAIQNDCVTMSNNHISYPGVTYKYVTAAQAMQLTQGYTDTTPPTFTITRNASTYVISSTETLWNNAPYVALQYADGTYTNMAATTVGTNIWTVTVPNSGSLVKVGVAASDLYGNPGLLTFSPLTPPTSSIPSAPPLPLSAPPEVQVPVHGVTATSQYNATYNAGQVIDGIESTNNFWASNAGIDLPSSVTIDLWNLTPLNMISTHFYDFTTRTYIYNIDFSADGQTWTPVVISRAASGVVNDTFSQTMTRYVRLTVTYGSANNVANIEEIKIYQQKLAPTPTPTPTPSPTPTTSSTPTPTPSPTPTPTTSSTATPTPTPTTSSTPTPTPTASPTPTVTPTHSPTLSPTPTKSLTPTNSSNTLSSNAETYMIGGLVVVIVVVLVATYLLVIRKRLLSSSLPPPPPSEESPPPPPPE